MCSKGASGMMHPPRQMARYYQALEPLPMLPWSVRHPHVATAIAWVAIMVILFIVFRLLS